MAAPSYQRLPGRFASLLSSFSLWETEDHLLLVESYRITESYKRFYFRDIQAVLITRTKVGTATALTLGFLTLIFGGLAVYFQDVAGIVLGIFGTVFLTLCLLQLVQGQTCRCFIRTAVQTREIKSLRRLRMARKVLARIQPKIDAAQAAAPPAP